MKTIITLIILFIALNTISCSKEETEGSGIPTELKGHVSDRIRGINISGFEVSVYKSCITFLGNEFENTGIGTTDENGNYSIKFDYNDKTCSFYQIASLTNKSSDNSNLYYVEEDNPFLEIEAGKTNILNINAWKPVQLELHIEVLNFENKSLIVYNEFVSHVFTYQLGWQDIWLPNGGIGTCTLDSRPDSDITIVFQYNCGTYPNLIEVKKTFNYHTTLKEVQRLNFTIDCSTF